MAEMKEVEQKSQLSEELEPLIRQDENRGVFDLLAELGEMAKSERRIIISSYPACNSTI